MGIEPTRQHLPGLKNRGFTAMKNTKCDGRVNIRGMWGHVGIRERTSARSNVSDGMPRLRSDISTPIPLCTPPPIDVEPQESARHLRRGPNDISQCSRTCRATVSTHAGRLRPGDPATDDPRVARKLAER